MSLLDPLELEGLHNITYEALQSIKVTQSYLMTYQSMKSYSLEDRRYYCIPHDIKMFP